MVPCFFVNRCSPFTWQWSTQVGMGAATNPKEKVPGEGKAIIVAACRGRMRLSRRSLWGIQSTIFTFATYLTSLGHWAWLDFHITSWERWAKAAFITFRTFLACCMCIMEPRATRIKPTLPNLAINFSNSWREQNNKVTMWPPIRVTLFMECTFHSNPGVSPVQGEPKTPLATHWHLLQLDGLEERALISPRPQEWCILFPQAL